MGIKNLLSIAALTLLVISCSVFNGKKNIEGTWRVSTSMSENGVVIDAGGTETLNGDETYEGQIKATVKVVDPSDNESAGIKVVMDIKSKGTWQLNDNEIVYSPNSCTVDVVSASVYSTDTGMNIMQITGSDLADLKRELVSQIQSSMLEPSKERIILQQDNKIVTESNEDGKSIKATYNRVVI